jgi:hypothetical protein
MSPHPLLSYACSMKLRHTMALWLGFWATEFEQKMAEVLCVYREVQVLKKAAKCKKPRKSVAIVSYDEKPGIRVIQRRAYGLRNEDYLRLKIRSCMLPAL